MYVLDTNVFQTLSAFYPKRFPTVWESMDRLVRQKDVISVREVRNELDLVCASDHINAWATQNRSIFVIPTPEECEVVSQIFRKQQYRGFVRRKSILRGSPVADPFIIAVAKVRQGTVVTQESRKPGAARIPTVCDELDIECINLENFFEEQGIQY